MARSDEAPLSAYKIRLNLGGYGILSSWWNSSDGTAKRWHSKKNNQVDNLSFNMMKVMLFICYINGEKQLDFNQTMIVPIGTIEGLMHI